MHHSHIFTHSLTHSLIHSHAHIVVALDASLYQRAVRTCDGGDVGCGATYGNGTYGYIKTPPGNGMISPPQKVFAEYLLKVNFSEKVRYDRVDQLGEALISVITNFL